MGVSCSRLGEGVLGKIMLGLGFAVTYPDSATR